MSEPWAVYDVEMETSIEWANKQLDSRRRELVEEASPRWIDRWDHGDHDETMRKAIDATYGKLRRAERGIRRSGARKKTSRQLDADIAQSLSSRAHATILGRGQITEDQARTLPRFDFIAHWLAVVTKKKENRDLAQGKRVRYRYGRWQIVYSNGLVEYETPDADRLFDYARRGPLNWHIRNAEEFRGLAHQRAAAVG